MDEPNGISVQRWSLSKPHLKGAVHGQVYSEIELCHPSWARSGEEGLSGSRRRRERSDRGGAQARTRQSYRLFLRASAVCCGDGSVPVGTSLGAAIAGARLRSEADPAGACEALCPAQQERRGRPAQRVERRRPLAGEQLAGPMAHQLGLVLDRPHRHEPLARSPRCLANRCGILCAVR